MQTNEIIPIQSPYNLLHETDSVTNLLTKLYPEHRGEEKELAKAKELLGQTGKQFTTEEIKDIVTKVQFLVQSWLDEYERQVFDGQTLNELLSSKQL